MWNLLRIEFKKTLPFKPFWALAGFYVVLLVLMFSAIAMIKIQGAPIDPKQIYHFPQIWKNITWWASWFNLLLGTIVVLLVSNEFSYKTLRQNVIDGLSRTDTLAAKLLVILCLALGSTALITFVGLIFGLIYSPDTSLAVIFKTYPYVLIYFVQAFAYMTIALCIGLLVRSGVLATLLFLFSIVIEGIVRPIFIPDPIGAYFPMKIISNLLPAPWAGHSIIRHTREITNVPMETAVLVTLGYIALFSLLSYGLLMKRDL